MAHNKLYLQQLQVYESPECVGRVWYLMVKSLITQIWLSWRQIVSRALKYSNIENCNSSNNLRLNHANRWKSFHVHWAVSGFNHFCAIPSVEKIKELNLTTSRKFLVAQHVMHVIFSVSKRCLHFVLIGIMACGGSTHSRPVHSRLQVIVRFTWRVRGHSPRLLISTI